MFTFLFLAGLISSTWASLNLHGAPLFSAETSLTFELVTSTLTKATSCYITSDSVSLCRRKRGIEEKPMIIQFDDDLEVSPSAVLPMEATAVPRAINSLEIFKGNNVFSSFDDSYFNSQNIFRQLAAKGGSNVVTVGDCGLSTVNLSQFLNCLGLTVRETTTLTATFTKTETLSSGQAIMTVMGCIPAGFPYTSCPATATETVQSSSTDTTIRTRLSPRNGL